jgi:hypothetical protein
MSRALAIDSTSQSKQQRAMETEPQNLQERIKLRAYELYVERGRLHGHHEEDWFDAEKEIRQQSQLHKAA